MLFMNYFLLFSFYFLFLNFNFNIDKVECTKIKSQKTQISFKNFIKKKSLETSYNGNSDVVEILNNIKDSAIQINKIISYLF